LIQVQHQKKNQSPEDLQIFLHGQTAIEFSELLPSHNTLYAVLGSQDIQN